ncbi:hypothetical protein [Tolypothrix sp. VBCCA 56010]|uniref:hypothetical protein n=1 Tax=Tolypothrix sp. VBCCA 56010 TaxID=3137731 RepID=UPI003D7EFBD7
MNCTTWLRKALQRLGLDKWDSVAWTFRLQGVFFAALIIIVIIVLGMLLSGCSARSSISGGESYLKTETTITPGSTTTTVTERVELTPDGKPAAVTTTNQTTVVQPVTSKSTEARAVGGRAETSGQDVKQDATIEAPRVKGENGQFADAGSADSKSEATGDGGRSMFIVASIVGIALAAGCALKRWFSAMFACLGFSGCCFMAGVYPEDTKLIILIGGVLVLVHVIYLNREKLGLLRRSTLLIDSIDKAPPEAKQAVKAEVAKKADASDVSFIRRVKDKLKAKNTVKAGDNPA